MINVTDRPIVLAEGAELDRRVRLGIQKFVNAINEKYAVEKKLELGKRKVHTFGKTSEKISFNYFAPSQLLETQYGNEFIQALMDISNINTKTNSITTGFINLNRFLKHKSGLSVSAGTRIRGHIRLLLLALWSEKAIMLPYGFHLGGSALTSHLSIIISFETEVASFFRKYKFESNDRGTTKPSLPISAKETLYKFGPRLIWASDYHRLEDIDIVEICELHRGISEDENGRFQEGSRPPLMLMLRELFDYQATRVRYSAKDLDLLALWLSSCKAREFSFEDFRSRPEDITVEIRINSLAASRHRDRLRVRKYKPVINEYGCSSQLRVNKNNELLFAAKRNDHDSVVEYFIKIRTYRNGLDWLSHRAPYPGREHLDIQRLSEFWIEAWSAWLKFRKNVLGYDTVKGPSAAFNLLCDYLFLYLPWWMELFPDNLVNFPLSPNQLKRSVFIHRTDLYKGESIPIDKLPLTFLDILDLRRYKPHSRYSVLKQLILFLDWIAVGFEDDERIAGKEYRNPINKIDLPRVKKISKSNKVGFSKKDHLHLLKYSYAVEAFGEYLQRFEMDNPLQFGNKYMRPHHFINTGPLPSQVALSGKVSIEYLNDWPDNFGYVPYYLYRGKNYPIYRCPDIFQWAFRKIDLERYDVSGGCSDCFLPHLSVIRLLIGAIETGLRLQSLQWLDLRKWDSLNKQNGVPVDCDFNMNDFKDRSYAYPLYISTDKTKNAPWDNLMPFRVRSCFHREQYFRDSIKEIGMDTLVDYEGIQNSRFGQILPLFRSHNSPKPVSDHKYMAYWIRMLWGFEEYFNTNVSAKDEFKQFVYMRGSELKQVPDYSETKPTNLLAISTPHANRVTYASIRVGLMDVSDIATQLGHANTASTIHYIKPTTESLVEKLLQVDLILQQENLESSHIRADSPKSALYKSFKINRSQTIDAFQFAPSASIWSTNDLNENYDGLALLKSSPASQITFRETHICPVGEVCPADIVTKIGGPHRCGICPLAMRCVDHLPAIAAKINQLFRHNQSNTQTGEMLKARKEPDSTVDAFYEVGERCVEEMVGWQFCHDTLLKMLHSRDGRLKGAIHIFEPEIVKKHLQLVSRDRPLIEFYLQSIIEANIYPSFNDPHIQLIAARYSRHIKSGGFLPSLDEDPVAIIAGYLKTQMDSRGLTLSDIAKEIGRIELAHKEGRSLLSGKQTFLLSDAEDDK